MQVTHSNRFTGNTEPAAGQDEGLTDCQCLNKTYCPKTGKSNSYCENCDTCYQCDKPEPSGNSAHSSESPITFEWVQNYDEFTDYEAVVNGELLRLTLVKNGKPYITEVL